LPNEEEDDIQIAAVLSRNS